MRLGVARSVLANSIVDGDVEVEGDTITAVGCRPAGRSGTATPGFTDLQVNGFAGVDFLAADVAGYLEAGQALLSTGVTAYQPTFICSELSTYRQAMQEAAAAQREVGGPRILGVHLEGPFIARERVGAHDPRYVRPPSVDEAAELLGLGPVTSMTLAPEKPGALELVRYLVSRGVVVSLGHSDADAETAHAAFDLGARTTTHLHNAQRRYSARDPGLVGVAQTRDDVVVQLIVDGIHLAPETVRLAWLAARGRFVLVTDAIAAAGLDDGRYLLGDRRVEKRSGAVRLADGTLAGSVLTMPTAIRNLVELGVDLPAAIGAATTVPASLLGRRDLADLRPGTSADIVILDDELEVRATFLDGALVSER